MIRLSIIDEIITSMTASKVFRNREILRPDYIPDTLPHRENEIRKLAQILVPAIKGERPSNVFIYGLTGTGKTAVTKYVLKNMYIKAKEKGYSTFSYAYINCRHSDTPYRVFADLANSVKVRVPFTGLPTSEVFKRFLRGLDKLATVFIIVLDEIDFLVRKHGDDVLYKLVRANEILSKSKVSLIGITNDINFVESLDPRIRSSLGEEELVFTPYNSYQLEDILRQRAKEAFNPGVLEDGVIELCAALAAREHGDARRALDLLRIAGEIAEREGSTRVTIDHVYKARDELEKSRTKEIIRTLPLHTKLILLSIALQTKGKTYTTTGEVYSYYKELVKLLRIEKLTQRRVSDLINELDMLGIINARVVSRGRYGKTKMITLSVAYDVVIDTLTGDPRIAEIIDNLRGR